MITFTDQQVLGSMFLVDGKQRIRQLTAIQVIVLL